MELSIGRGAAVDLLPNIGPQRHMSMFRNHFALALRCGIIARHRVHQNSLAIETRRAR
jgi:hypothetical protein